MIVPIDPEALVTMINSNPFPLLRGHDPGLPLFEFFGRYRMRAQPVSGHSSQPRRTSGEPYDFVLLGQTNGARNGESESAQARKALPAYSNLKNATGSVSDGRSRKPLVQSIQSAIGSASMRMKLDRCEESAI